MVELGRATCDECGGRKVLIVNPKGVWSVCKRCGFMEWEWAPGDSIAYLEYLASRYHLDPHSLLKAVEEAINP